MCWFYTWWAHALGHIDQVLVPMDQGPGPRTNGPGPRSWDQWAVQAKERHWPTVRGMPLRAWGGLQGPFSYFLHISYLDSYVTLGRLHASFPLTNANIKNKER